jgi:hypothetical protein
MCCFRFRRHDDRVHSSLKAFAGSWRAAAEGLRSRSIEVVIQFPVPFAAGSRLLDNLPILPKHKLAAALDSGGPQTSGRLAGRSIPSPVWARSF